MRTKTMNMLIHHKIFIYVAFSLIFGTISYESMTQPLNPDQIDIRAIARPLPDSIMIRWAPANVAAWIISNENGYFIERYTIMRDNRLLPRPEVKKINTMPMKPLQLNEWEPYVMKNKYAAIAAQALYGETFEISGSGGLNPSQIYALSEEQRQRWSFALYAADISPEVAKISGLLYTDKSAKANEMYLYKIYTNNPATSKFKLDTGFVYTGISDYAPLPVPIEVEAIFSDKVAQIKWNAFVHNHLYIGYFIEKSDDQGKTFKKLNEELLLQMYDDESDTEYMYKLDSLDQNNKEYHYRIKGVTSFGEEGPWSAIAKGVGKEMINAAPNLTKYDLHETKVVLYWDFPKEMEGSITGFRILRSDNIKNFKPINNIGKSARQFTDNKPIPTAYYKIEAWRDGANSRESFPVLVQLTDSVPPAIPVGLIGMADTLGIVRLSWTPNTDVDIFGYRVFKAASEKEEFYLLTGTPIQDPHFTDTLEKRDLNSNVFYKIRAIDQRQNESDFSAILKVEKPDLIPPSPPVIRSITVGDKGVKIDWVNSSSSDVVHHVLLKQVQSDTTWIEVKTFKFSTNEIVNSHTDRTGEHENVIYKIMVKDKAGNVSYSATSTQIVSSGLGIKSGVKRIKQTYDSNSGKLYLNWQLPVEATTNILIYRKAEGKPYYLYETLPDNTTLFEDYGMKAGQTYAYRLKVVFADGSVSGFSEEIVFKF